jgi:uncharacterized protein YggE
MRARGTNASSNFSVGSHQPTIPSEAAVTKVLARRLIVVATLAAALPSSARAQVSPLPSNTWQGIPMVAVTGHGEAHIPPDRATVVLSVETTGLAAAEVGATNAHIQRRVLDTLRALGYSGSEISTTSYNMTPNYEPAPTGERNQRGYVARNAVRVKVTQLDHIGIVIDAALARGANGVEDVSFEASNTDAARQTALADATAQARLNASALAKAMGGTLGKLIDVTMQDALSDGTLMHAKMGLAQTSITPSDLTIESNVIARWQFVPGR